jgi:hypothetical protein
MAREQRLLSEGVNANEVEFEGTTETVVAIVEGVTTDVAAREVFLSAQLLWLSPAEAEKMTVRFRLGTTTAGTEVFKAVFGETASANNDCYVAFRHVPGELAGGSYCLTMEEKKAGKKTKPISIRIRAEV